MVLTYTNHYTSVAIGKLLYCLELDFFSKRRHYFLLALLVLLYILYFQFHGTRLLDVVVNAIRDFVLLQCIKKSIFVRVFYSNVENLYITIYGCMTKSPVWMLQKLRMIIFRQDIRHVRWRFIRLQWHI